jgi:hypothetical protein
MVFPRTLAEEESSGVWRRLLSSSLSFPTSLWDCCVSSPVALPYSLLLWKIDRPVAAQRLVGRLCSGLFCFDRVCFSCVCVCVSERELTSYIVIISDHGRRFLSLPFLAVVPECFWKLSVYAMSDDQKQSVV